MEEVSLAVGAMNHLLNRNLKRVVRIYFEQRRLLVKEIHLINRIRRNPRTSKDKKDDLWLQKKLYVSDFRTHLILTAYLMFYSHLEEMLEHISPDFNISSNSKRKTGIEKAKVIFHESFAINISEFYKWQDLKDFSKLRNYILHANGNGFLIKSASEFNDILKRQNRYVYIYNGRIRLRPAIINDFEELLYEFTKWLLTKKKNIKKTNLNNKINLVGNK